MWMWSRPADYFCLPEGPLIQMAHDFKYVLFDFWTSFTLLPAHHTTFHILLGFLPQLVSSSVVWNNFCCSMCRTTFLPSVIPAAFLPLFKQPVLLFAFLLHFAPGIQKWVEKGEKKWKFHQFRAVKNKTKSSGTLLTAIRLEYNWTVFSCEGKEQN